MKFAMRAITLGGDGKQLEVMMDLLHSKDAVRGQLAVVIEYSGTDTLDQIAMRAGEALDVAIAAEEDDL